MNFLQKLTLAALAVFIGQTGAKAETLNSQQIKSVMIGKSVSWVTPDGKSQGFALYRPNGTASVTVTAPNKFNDSGTWRMQGNQFCSTWQVIRDGQEGCSTVRTTTKQGVFRTDTTFIRPQ
jgi:ABC-type phosphate transport system substrate-binding protein